MMGADVDPKPWGGGLVHEERGDMRILVGHHDLDLER